VIRRQEFHPLATVPHVVTSGVVRAADELDCTLESAALPVCSWLLMGITKAVPSAERISSVGKLFFTGDYLVGRF
jgi:hypothetical protein